MPLIKMKRKAKVFLTDSNEVIQPPRRIYEDDGGRQPHEVAVWIKPQHRVLFLLTISLYKTPRRTVGGYNLLPELTSQRIGCWRNEKKQYFIGCKGTSLTGPTAKQDLMDDAAVAGLAKLGENDVTLVGEAIRVLNILVKLGVSTSQISVGGHSLGGYAAFMLSTKYSLQCCVFNAAAPPTKPILVGPGPALATHYHVAGDFISSHMLGTAAEIIRADKNHNYFFNAVWAHNTDRFFAEDTTLGFMDANQEDVLFMALGAVAPVFLLVPNVQFPGLLGQIASLAGGEAIPGSTRSLTSNDDVDFEQLFKSGEDIFRMVQDGKGYIDLVDMQLGKIAQFFEGSKNLALLTKTEAGEYAAKNIGNVVDRTKAVREYTTYAKAVSSNPAALIDNLAGQLVESNVTTQTLQTLEAAGVNPNEFKDDLKKTTKATFGFTAKDKNVGLTKALKDLNTPTLAKISKIKSLRSTVGAELLKFTGKASPQVAASIDQEINESPDGELNARQQAAEIFIKFQQLNIETDQIIKGMAKRGFQVQGVADAYLEIQKAKNAASSEIAVKFGRAAEKAVNAVKGVGERLVAQFGTTAAEASSSAATAAARASILESARAAAKKVSQSVVVKAGKAAAERAAASVTRAVISVGESAIARAGAKVAAKVAQMGGRLLVQAAVTGTAFLANPIVGAIVGAINILVNIYFLIDLGISLAELGAYQAEGHQLKMN